jgi:hypothetical protein
VALVHTNNQITTTARPIIEIPAGIKANIAAQIYNNTGSTIYLGDASVTATGATIGNAIANGASLQLWLGASDIVYAICATNPAGYVSVLYAGV